MTIILPLNDDDITNNSNSSSNSNNNNNNNNKNNNNTIYNRVGKYFLSPFGQDDIHEIKGENSTFARGTFGELSLAIKGSNTGTCSSDSGSGISSSNSSQPTTLSGKSSLKYSLVAVKKIRNALTDGGNQGHIFGQSQSQSHQPRQQRLANEVFNELLAIKLLNNSSQHPNIVTLLAVMADKSGGINHGSLSLVFSYCPIDLHEVLEIRRRNFQQPLAFRFIKTIFRDVFDAIAHCHDNGILHRDIKPSNLLVSGKGRIILCDFGLAKPFLSFDDDEIENANEQSGINSRNGHVEKGLCTLHYRPPEVLLGGPSIFPSVDIWSAGIVLTELIGGHVLWRGRNVIDQISLVYNSLGTPNEETWPDVRILPDYGKLQFKTKLCKQWNDILPRATETPMLIDLVSTLLKLNPKQRLTSRQAIDSKWLMVHSVTEGGSLEIENDSRLHRELHDELVRPSALQIPPLLFPENRQLLETIGLKAVHARVSINKETNQLWQGPSFNSLMNHDQLSEQFRSNYCTCVERPECNK